MINGDHSVLETVALFFVFSVNTERFHSIENAHKDRPPDQKCCGDFVGPDQNAKGKFQLNFPKPTPPPSLHVFYQIRRLALQEGDTLVVCKLDRFARTAIEGVQTVRELFERGVRVHILNMGLIENTLTGNLILTVMLAFAEYERGMIVERTQTGKAVARQDPSFKDGRPKKFSPEQIELALSLLEQGKTYRQITTMTGISKSTLIRAKREA